MKNRVYTSDFETRGQAGLYGEYYSLAELARRGIPAMKLSSSLSDCDLITRQNSLIEVKTAKPQIKDWQMKGYSFRAWQFTNHSLKFNRNENLFKSSRRRRKCDYYIFVGLKSEIILVDRVWIIPEEIVKDKRTLLFIDTENQMEGYLLNINNKRGEKPSSKWYDRYLNKWDLIDK